MDARVKNAGSSAWPANSRAALNTIEARASDGAVFVEWTDVELSYAELLDGIRRCCGVFDSRNLKPGDRVLILCRREREAIVTFLAAMLDGLVPVMLTPDTPAMRAKP